MGLVALDGAVYHADQENRIRLFPTERPCGFISDADTMAAVNGITAKQVQRNARSIDSQIHFYQRCGCCGLRIRILGIIRNYFPDPESGNNGLLYCWTNPFRCTASSVERDLSTLRYSKDAEKV